ncbi:hypothetical protein ABZP36_001068 [Zizania latifolia]
MNKKASVSKELNAKHTKQFAVPVLCVLCRPSNSDKEPATGLQIAGMVLKLIIFTSPMHLDDKTGAYFDYGNHTEKVRLRWYEVTDNDVMRQELLCETLQSPQLQLVAHVGKLVMSAFSLSCWGAFHLYALYLHLLVSHFYQSSDAHPKVIITIQICPGIMGS